MFTYICFYKNKQIEVNALTSFSAQEIAGKLFIAKKSYEITVILSAKNNEQIEHIATF